MPLRAVREGHARGEEAKHIARTSQVHGRRPTNTPQRGEESAGGTARGASLGRGLRKAGALHLHLGIFQVVLEFGLAKVRVSLESMSSSRYGCELAIVGIPMSRIPWGRIRRGRDEHPRIHSRATPEFRIRRCGEHVHPADACWHRWVLESTEPEDRRQTSFSVLSAQTSLVTVSKLNYRVFRVGFQL